MEETNTKLECGIPSWIAQHGARWGVGKDPKPAKKRSKESRKRKEDRRGARAKRMSLKRYLRMRYGA